MENNMNKEVLLEQIAKFRRNKSEHDKYTDVLLIVYKLVYAYEEDDYLSKEDIKDLISELIEDMYSDDYNCI